jgi:predicted  nucleic acid-binding Zn-ribbon protein
VKDLTARIVQADMPSLQAKLRAKQEEIAATEREIATLGPTLTELQKELASQQHTKHNVVANVELREYRVQLEALDQQLQQTRQELTDMQVRYHCYCCGLIVVL